MLVLNDLSYTNKTIDENLFNNFFETLFLIEKWSKLKITLKIYNHEVDILGQSDSAFLKWINTSDRDKKRRILSLLDKDNSIVNYPSYKINDSAYNQSFAFAHGNKNLLVSFDSDELWRQCKIEVTEDSIDEINDEILSIKHKLNNIYNTDVNGCIKEHESFLNEKITFLKNKEFLKIKKTITNSISFWKEKEKHFPSLIFCESLKKDADNISGVNFINFIERLFEFENYFSCWENGDFDRTKINGNPRPESKTRKKLNDLKILCPDGDTKIFSLHCDFGFKGNRLHFFIEEDVRKCIIGYAGKKILK